MRKSEEEEEGIFVGRFRGFGVMCKTMTFRYTFLFAFSIWMRDRGGLSPRDLPFHLSFFFFLLFLVFTHLFNLLF